MIDVELFAGPGGTSEGRRIVGADTLPLLALEWERWACRTAVAAGHHRVRADVAAFPPRHLRDRVRLLMASPPCPTFSTAGNGGGMLGLGMFAAAQRHILVGIDIRADIRQRHEAALRDAAGNDPKALARAPRDAATSVLVLEPARWIEATHPETVVLEQVPTVLPIWRALAHELRERNWSAWSGILCAADYGVPQTRYRAILLASRVRMVAPPVPTHAEDAARDLFGELRLPWVTMAQALGWDGADWPARTVAGRVMVGFGRKADSGPATGDGLRVRDFTPIDEPAPNLMVKARWWLRMGSQTRATRRTLDQPAPTVLGGHASNDISWVQGRPATTVLGTPRISPPGHRDRAGGEQQFGPGTVKVTVEELAALQGFPPTWPWQGSRTRQVEQIADAVPPPLAAHCIAAALGQPPAPEVAA